MVDRGRVGERAKEALVDGLNGFSYDTSLGAGGGGGVLPECTSTCALRESGDGMEGRSVGKRELGN